MIRLTIGSRGATVTAWQHFLVGQGCDPKGVDGGYGNDTAAATRAFQATCSVPASGNVDDATWTAAIARGFGGPDGALLPPPPNFPPLVSIDHRQDLFGHLEYVADPQPDNKENVRITNGWESNIVSVPLPQLAAVGGPARVRWHTRAQGQLVALWAAWEKAGLLPRISSWGGSYVPRFIRGSQTVLSNHAFGTAFDINAAWNPLGACPALLGKPGCVRELVGIANEHGFYWGGHFTRLDGMHFEVARLQ